MRERLVCYCGFRNFQCRLDVRQCPGCMVIASADVRLEAYDGIGLDHFSLGDEMREIVRQDILQLALLDANCSFNSCPAVI